MPDPFTVWLSHVDPQLLLIASISISLAAIFRSVEHVLGSVLGMWTRIRSFRRSLNVASVSRRQPVAKSREKRSVRGSDTST